MVERVRQLIAGEWLDGEPVASSVDPATGTEIAVAPATSWAQIDRAISEGVQAEQGLTELGPEPVARFLQDLASRIEARADELVDAAHRETGLPVEPRLRDVELPRTTDQLRQAAGAAQTRSWKRPTISTAVNIRSMMTPLPGPVVTIGPSNFPFAFNSITGGDAAAAWASGHPVIAKVHPSHLLTSYLLAQEVSDAAAAAGLPVAMIQVVYIVDPADGLRMVADRRIAATAFTGSRRAGMALKDAADSAGVPIYLEMSSVNPVVVLSGAAADRPDEIAGDLIQAITSGVGQFCTKPGLVFVVDDGDGRRVLDALARRVGDDRGGLMMTRGLLESFEESVEHLVTSGADRVAAGARPDLATGAAAQLLVVDASTFMTHADDLQTEAFGPAMLAVRCADVEEIAVCLSLIEGSLAATVYGTAGDDVHGTRIVDVLTPRVGRIVSNRPPTGVKVVAAMNHGGPYPSTGHPGSTAVGIPRSLERFAKLTCFDGMPDRLLPPELQDANPLGIWRDVDGQFTAAR